MYKRQRVQGARWNDVTDHSLTSEFFDYLQFYKKNRDLSADAKEKCHMQLQKAKNRFKDAFILDYMAWVLYESAGSPRLNKVTRQILSLIHIYFRLPYRDKKWTEFAAQQKGKQLTFRYHASGRLFFQLSVLLFAFTLSLIHIYPVHIPDHGSSCP